MCVTLSSCPCLAHHTGKYTGRLSDPTGPLALLGSPPTWAQASFGMWGSYRPRRAVPSRIPGRRWCATTANPKAETRVRGVHIGLGIVLRMRDRPTSISVQADPVSSASVVKGARPHKTQLASFQMRPSHPEAGPRRRGNNVSANAQGAYAEPGGERVTVTSSPGWSHLHLPTIRRVSRRSRGGHHGNAYFSHATISRKRITSQPRAILYHS